MSVGFPVYEDDKCVVLAQSFSDDSVSDLVRILKAEIRDIRHMNNRPVAWRVGNGRKIFRYEHDQPK